MAVTPSMQRKAHTANADQMQKMQMIASDLVKFYLGSSWKFEWSFSMSPAGRCWNHRNVIEFGVRDAVVLGVDEFVETVLHEIAHALCSDGSNKGHNETWKRIYLSIGGNGTVTANESILWESKHRHRLLIERGFKG